jgi:hypothetical protein
VARSMDDVVAMARRPDWPGYFGTPAIGNAAAGSRGMNAIAQSAVDAVRRLLNGEDLDTLTRAADQAAANAAFKRLTDASLDHERHIEEKHRAWLDAHKR